jgi:hypothetical protein
MIPKCLEIIDKTHFRCPKYGFIIITDKFPINCDKCSRPKMNMNSGPSFPKMASNFGKAAVKFIKNGCKFVTLEQYKARLEQCNKNECGFYNGSRCLHPDCGCFLSKKAWLESEDCPLELWESVNFATE